MTAKLDELWRAGGLNVNAVTGWQTRQRSGSWAPCFGIIHHTAGAKSLPVIVNGRSDLPGPLANAHVPKDGAINLVSAGRCNHAGAGAQAVVDRVRRDQPPLGTAAMLGLADGPVGNGLAYGFELENLGDGRDPWPEAQLNAAALAAALLCRHHGWSADRWVGHLEWTRRKIDPAGFGMAKFRDRVRWLLATLGAPPAPAPPVILPSPPAAVRHEVDMATTHPITVPLDDKGRGNITTGFPVGKIIGKPWIQVPVRPNVDGYYPGDPDKIDPRNFESDDAGNLCVIVRGCPKTVDPARPETVTVHVTVAD